MRRNYLGIKFYYLRVIANAPDVKISGHRYRQYLMKCICGKEKVIPSQHLGRVKSCGCKHRELVSAGHRTHGLTNTTEFTIWQSMLSRCLNSNDANYRRYGARGITVCDSWAASFQNFLDDMGKRPSQEYSLDRIDNDGGYHPENCKWSTKKEQAINRRNTRKLAFQGMSLTIEEWSKLTGLNINTINSRLCYGWCVEDVLTQPVAATWLRRRKRQRDAEMARRLVTTPQGAAYAN